MAKSPNKSSVPAELRDVLISTPERRLEPSADFPTHESIELRAYGIYVERGRVDGHDVEDWLQAECDLLAEFASRRKPIAA